MDTDARLDLSQYLKADKRALDTPALLVDLDALDANIARIAGTCRQHGINWRPHTKGIKVPQIAQRLIDAGAIGITCAKLGEAEVMASAGIKRHPDRQSDRRPAEDRAARRIAAHAAT